MSRTFEIESSPFAGTLAFSLYGASLFTLMVTGVIIFAIVSFVTKEK